MNEICKVTLAEILEARDNRYKKQRQLIAQYKATLVILTLNIPGEEKTNIKIEKAFEEGYKALKSLLDVKYNVLYEKKIVLNTGNEGYFAVKANSMDIKREAIYLENRHFLGRLFDIDVISEQVRPISRSELGFERRQCFVCTKSAVECSRNKAHSEEVLQNVLNELLSQINEP